MVTRVIKLGGSLLELNDWVERVTRWLSEQSKAKNLFVVGGGERVETLRERQRAEGFGDEQAHIEAFRLMDLNAVEVASVLTGARLIRNWQPDVPLAAESVLILECGVWAANEPVFERSWRTTSDSVSAEIAARVNAEELVLLKSCLPQGTISTYVDSQFVEHARPDRNVRFVNLRDETFPETRWQKKL